MGWFSLFALLAAIAAAVFIVLRLYKRGLLIPVAKQPLEDMVTAMREHTRIYAPEGDGPFPAIMLLHGCGGVRPNMPVFARLAVDLGVMAFVPDSLGPRGISYEDALESVCTGARLRAHERTGDLYAVLEIMRNDPRVDATRLAIAGWSHGSWTALEALALDRAGKLPASLTHIPSQGLDGIRAIFAMYPYSSFPARSRRLPWTADIPVEGVLVHGDTICNDEDAVEVFKRQIGWGNDVRWRYVPDATHAFDEPDHHPTSTLIYDEEKARIAHQAFQDFLRRHLLADQGSAD
ncbi:dienelactone hydrolase family protein [Hyphobacterium sp. HN65]|uniref:Dienelactone hydrolase family protein n=1 Tax=Hyphobacterium lacteum TaxID=3116575 RepID=A0ABU7LRL6_9PROT|nr:dienelactone hydrolase family protein [Hyphobacterium sp. HN65]MEE2526556.1 dienelactone hydrolase family protein [Hyphobacterium sp. HN65]